MMRSARMILFTIREAILRGTLVFYFFFGTAVIIFFALALHVSDDGSSIMMFQSKVMPSKMNEINPAEFLLLILHKTSASAIMLLGIFGVAGMIPSMLEKGTIDLFLSKPLSRTSLLLSRVLGAVAGISLNIMYFALGIWFIFGVKIGVWHGAFLLSSAVVCVVFFLYFSIVALVGLVTQSQGISIIAAFVYSFFSSGLQAREHGLYFLWNNTPYHRFLDFLYYVTPQIADMLDNSSILIGKDPFTRRLTQSAISFDVMPFVYSFCSAAAIYALSAWYFSKKDF